MRFFNKWFIYEQYFNKTVIIYNTVTIFYLNLKHNFKLKLFKVKYTDLGTTITTNRKNENLLDVDTMKPLTSTQKWHLHYLAQQWCKNMFLNCGRLVQRVLVHTLINVFNSFKKTGLTYWGLSTNFRSTKSTTNKSWQTYVCGRMHSFCKK